MEQKRSRYQDFAYDCEIRVADGNYVPTITDVDLEEEFSQNPLKCERSVRSVFTTDEFGSSGDKRNLSMLVFRCGEDGGD